MIRSVPRIVELFKPASGLQAVEGGGRSRGKGFSKARKSGAIGREFKLDFVLPRRYKNLKRGGKRGQTSSILSELLPERVSLFLLRFCPFPSRTFHSVKKDLLRVSFKFFSFSFSFPVQLCISYWYSLQNSFDRFCFSIKKNEKIFNEFTIKLVKLKFDL